MPHAKASKRITNLDLPLQHIRSVIEGRYVLYQECVTAITRAAERREDASAWFEQLEQLVVGIDAIAFSHAGLVFLLRELMRGEGKLRLLGIHYLRIRLTFNSSSDKGDASSSTSSPHHTSRHESTARDDAASTLRAPALEGTNSHTPPYIPRQRPHILH